MNLFTRKIHMFCVSNIMVSFVCTGFLGMNGYTITNPVPENETEISLASSELEPASLLGDEKNKADNLEAEKKVTNEKQGAVTQVTKTKSTNKNIVTKVVTKKKEVTSTKKYTPAKYDAVTGTAVVEYAKKYLGLRYVSGGNSLSKGTDCSGFTKLIYKEFGVTLSRAVRGQVGNGSYVSKSNLRPGDLVFYGNKSNTVSHVGIYMGNGKVIHESNPRDGVKISSVNMMRYITARRVINSKAIEIANAKEETKKLEEQKLTDTTSNTNIETINDKVAANDLSIKKENNENNIKDTTSTTVKEENTTLLKDNTDNIKEETTKKIEEKEETKKETISKVEDKTEAKETTKGETAVKEETKTEKSEVKEETIVKQETVAKEKTTSVKEETKVEVKEESKKETVKEETTSLAK